MAFNGGKKINFKTFRAYATINYWTISVTYCVANSLPFNLLLGIFLLFQLENMFVEIELEIFISIIYTKLFKAVFLQ
jgi:hypothetical protein